MLADPIQAHNALLNLAINARDAMPDGGRLIIETSNVELDESAVKSRADAEPGHYVRLSVRDGGLRDCPSLGTRTDEARAHSSADPTYLRESLRQAPEERCG